MIDKISIFQVYIKMLVLQKNVFHADFKMDLSRLQQIYFQHFKLKKNLLKSFKICVKTKTQK